MLLPKPTPATEDKFAELKKRGVIIAEGSSYDVPRDVKFIVLENGLLQLSVLILYDEFNQSDFIEGMREDQNLATQLAEMLPGPWDTEGRLRLENAKAYFESQGKYTEVSLSTPLIEILLMKNYEMPQMPAFHITSQIIQ